MKIWIITANDVVEINHQVCAAEKTESKCLGLGKIESAIHSTFYPGNFPFHHGGLAKVAGALAYYICQAHAFLDGNKRTATLAALTFLNLNGYDIRYKSLKDSDDLSDLMIRCANGKCSIDELKKWFESHKVATRK